MAFSFTNGINLHSSELDCSFGVNQLQQSGNIVYEYNPLKVLRINSDKTIDSINYPSGSLIGLDTNKLGFDLNHPVDIITQQSYDGSVNLIINDGSTNPKLINTRFSTTGMNTYQIVDRQGDNDTNIYDENTFSSDISLYKKTNTIPELTFEGLSTNGNLKVGNYVFYFKLADADGNETDFIAESGIVTCYIGNINDPFSEEGGMRDENSHKAVTFLLSNIDSSYNNIVVYFTRSSSDIDGNYFTSAHKLNKQFSVYNKNARITVTGYEEEIPNISLNDINVAYNVIDHALCQTANQNMLFMGNVANADLPYKELTDLSLRFLPQINTSNSIGHVDQNYKDSTGEYEYYNANNIYYKLGYWNDEIYRFGVVYILNDYTLSPVFNVRGIRNLYDATSSRSETSFDYYPVRNKNGEREYIEIDKETFSLRNTNENCKGVVHIVCNGVNQMGSETIPIGINFKIQSDAIDELKNYVKGFFFVRQRRKPTTLCQAITIGLEATSCLPVLPVGMSDDKPTYLVERFLDDDRILTHNFERRIKTIDSNYVLSGYAALCPEFEQKQSFFNQLFTGTSYVIKHDNSMFTTKYFNRNGNYLYNISYDLRTTDLKTDTYNIMAIADGIKVLVGNKQAFKAKAGEAEEAFRISYYSSNTKTDTATNILRGSYGPYIGLEGYNTSTMELVDIKIPNYSESELDNYFVLRYEDPSEFRAISDRISIDSISLTNEKVGTKLYTNEAGKYDDIYNYKISDIFRGDCYICNYTHRMVRNFQDPAAPVNSDFISTTTWKDNYSATDYTKSGKINRGDVNAVNIGHWVTVKVCSSVNLSLRSLDLSYPSEKGLTGKYRGFFPRQAISVSGESKIPESFVINTGISNSLSDKYQYEVPDFPAFKNKFHTRIMYSDVNVNDAFKNGYRVFRIEKYQDYPTTYGEITKLISWFGYIICVFEHGVSLIPVNERALLGGADGGNVYINTSNVLPENPKMLSDRFGSQWSESVIKTENFVYGVDTVGKKIWRTNGTKFEIISDFKVQRFLNDNISLSEKETTPIIGIRNVKTHYNAFKKDIMFTFYDDINVLEENAWNLCYNEILGCFTTFYSWIPSYSENIDNIFFTFDRDTSKTITKLSNSYPMLTISGTNISSSGNLILDSLDWTTGDYIKIGTVKFNISNIILKNYNIDSNYLNSIIYTYSIADNRVRNIYNIDSTTGELSIKANQKDLGPWTIPIKIDLSFSSTLANENGSISELPSYKGNLVIANKSYIDKLTTSFWKHGKAGLMFTTAPIKPCMWYNKQHPFEFEFVVTNAQSIQKIYNNLRIISNSVKPESLHFEIVGDSYNFAEEKKNAYFRQEATKHLYQYNGADIVYNSDYPQIEVKQSDIPFNNTNLKKATIMFPLYYSRVNTLNEIYDHYQSMTSADKDYQWLSGTEIVHDKVLDEYRLATHIKACPFDEMYAREISESEYNNYLLSGYSNIGTSINNGITKYYLYNTYGRINGNMNYQEDKWDVQIPSIHYWAKNEKQWLLAKEEISEADYNTYSTIPYNYDCSYDSTTKKYYLNHKCVPLNLVNNPLPESMDTLNLFSSANNNEIPEELQKLGYTYDNYISSTKSDSIVEPIFDTSKWYGNDGEYTNLTDSSFETKIRDKYLKVKIRYTGDRLAVISAINTIFTISYA
jgi:hypothetical protein